MLLSILPKVSGIKVESSWGHGRKGMVHCLARLTRPLTAQEAERLRELLPIKETEGDRIAYDCRLSEVEEWREWLTRSLALAARPDPVSARGRGSRRRRAPETTRLRRV